MDRVTAGQKLGFWGKLKRLALTDVGALVRGLNAEDVEALGLDYGLTHSCYDPDEAGRHCVRCRWVRWQRPRVLWPSE